MHAPDTSPPTVDQLVRSSDPIQTFLNAYAVCSGHQERAYNLLQDDSRDLDYQNKTKTLLKILGATQSQTDLPVNEFKNALSAAGSEDRILCAFALLTALAKHIDETYGSELSKYGDSSRDSDGNEYWLALDYPGLFGGRMRRPPKSSAEISRTLSCYHDPLVVTPVSVTVPPAREPEWRLQRIPARECVETYVEPRLESGRFRVAVSPLSNNATVFGESRHIPVSPEYDPAYKKPYKFHVTAVQPEQFTTLRTVLEQAWDKGASILVLPELRMPLELLAEAKKFLQGQTVTEDKGLLLVAAGSWHVAHEKSGQWYNRCVVLDQHGEELWKHDKMREFHIDEENVQEAPDFYRDLGVGNGGGQEDIRRGNELQFYDSVIGRIAVAICVGFFHDDIQPLLRASLANLFLVPAMTSSIRDFEDKARALVRQHAATFVANSGNVGKKSFSFYQLPKRNAVPTHLGTSEDLLVFHLNHIDLTDV